MSELTHYVPTDHEIAVIKNGRQSTGLDAIDAENAVIEKAAGTVKTLILGGMAPNAYMPEFQPKKNGPQQGLDVALAKGLAAAVYGATLGFGVAKSLQNVFTVHGMPSIYARTAVALVMSYGHEVETVESGPTEVTVRARRKGSDYWEYSTWDIGRARKAGFTSNPKYDSQPEEMLYSKAAMTVCRRRFADVLEGVPYSVEELESEAAPLRVESTRLDRPERGAGARGSINSVKQRLAAAAPPSDPEPAPEPAAAPPVADTAAPIANDPGRFIDRANVAESVEELQNIFAEAAGEFPKETDEYASVVAALDAKLTAEGWAL